MEFVFKPVRRVAALCGASALALVVVGVGAALWAPAADAQKSEVAVDVAVVEVVKQLTDGSVDPAVDFEFELESAVADCDAAAPANVFVAAGAMVLVEVPYEIGGVECGWTASEVNLPAGCTVIGADSTQSLNSVKGEGDDGATVLLNVAKTTVTVWNECVPVSSITVTKILADGSMDPGVEFDFEIQSLVDPQRCVVEPATLSIAAGTSTTVSVTGESIDAGLKSCQYRIGEVNLPDGCAVVGEDRVVVIAPSPQTEVVFTNDCGPIATAAIDIEKSTNEIDADTQAEGPLLALPNIVVWTYTITNTGNTSLANVTVTDDQLDSQADITCAVNGTFVANVIPGVLDPGDTFECQAFDYVVIGDYANVGSVVATPSDAAGAPLAGLDEVTDTDLSHYTGTRQGPAVEIEKSTSGLDADNPGEGPILYVGDPVIWTYVVTNMSSTFLMNITVTDDDPSIAVDCGTGSNVFVGPIQPGDRVTCTASGVAGDSPYINIGTVQATPSDAAGNPIAGSVDEFDSDPSTYQGQLDPSRVAAVSIEKSTNGVDADTQEQGPTLAIGAVVSWDYTVTNTGNVYLANFTVTDNRVPDIDCGADDPSILQAPLAPGDSFTCTATGSAIEGAYSNLGSVTAEPPTLRDFHSTGLTRRQQVIHRATPARLPRSPTRRQHRNRRSSLCRPTRGDCRLRLVPPPRLQTRSQRRLERATKTRPLARWGLRTRHQRARVLP